MSADSESESTSARRGLISESFQVLHAHVLLVTPLGTSHVSQSGTDQHQGGIAVRESANDPGASSNLAIQALM